MKLDKLLQSVGIKGAPVRPIEITGISTDSRTVLPGHLFVAVQGVNQDGRAFVPAAIRRGAVAVLSESKEIKTNGVPVIIAGDLRKRLGPLAQAIFSHPARGMDLIGVTGTNGKTTVSTLVQKILTHAGIDCGLVGTVEVLTGGEPLPAAQTTPGPVQLAGYLNQMREHQLKSAVLEVSSHALDQRRVGGLQFKIGVFTNLTLEHLEYHNTFERYRDAKIRLFSELSPESTAVINNDDLSVEQIRSATSARVVTFGCVKPADVQVVVHRQGLEGSTGELLLKGDSFHFHTPLLGEHNLSNIAAAAAVGLALQVPPEAIIGAIQQFSGVSGRLERVECGQPFPVLVDYAHTDDALEKVLLSLRSLTDRKLILVFGCGGDRDRSKRAMMGKVAAHLAHQVIVTSDNPRGESPDAIAQEIMKGFKSLITSCTGTVVIDRREAIEQALSSADENSLVLIAGKGHETTQVFKDQTVSFDDRVVTSEVLERIQKGVVT